MASIAQPEFPQAGRLQPGQEIRFLLRLSAQLKAAKYTGNETQRLVGKEIALIFEKSSTRTRTAFEVAAFDQGANVTYLGPSGTQIGAKESMKDTARVLGRVYDAIDTAASPRRTPRPWPSTPACRSTTA